MKQIAALACILALSACSKSPADQCFETAKARTKDPQSTTLVSTRAESNGTVKVELRASNSYGAFSSLYVICNATGTEVTGTTTDRLKWALAP